ncbi:MAG: ribose 5-phosphate isomerase B [Ignavibacteriales bacterium]|jgi:ribose 5-phosphate isomerase B|nr:ribose 5-phosphate isomerase B [Ignavibacteriaceae bacterium]NLH60085.1 ribose 5-phosphate isomerase B [Ignavibacteriales bacterium]HOJ19215.1 ribose 5-phosphate isomerase B [Ignavibacteriaceae bacterium]
MKIFIGADHGGFELKEKIKDFLVKNKFETEDTGSIVYDKTDDYPDLTINLAQKVTATPGSKGIMICGSGVGACVAANKIKGIRACVCHDTYSAHQGVEHDNMNVLCLGGRIVGYELAFEIVGAFVRAEFSNEERHIRRLEKVLKLEN